MELNEFKSIEDNIKQLEEELRIERSSVEKRLKELEEELKRKEEELRGLSTRAEEVDRKLEENRRLKREVEEGMRALKKLSEDLETGKEKTPDIVVGATNKEVKKLLTVLDKLLGELPDDVMKKFIKSKNYKLYEKVMSRYGVE